MKMHVSKIIGTGSFLPHKMVSNAQISRQLPWNAEQIYKLTGIRSRRWVEEEEECSYLAQEATKEALQSCGLSLSSIDAILVSTTSPDMPFPSTACHLQRRLGIRNVPCFDIAASCSGFLYGLSMADCFIRIGQFQRCLVVAAEIKSRYLTPQERDSVILFGDGAGAAVVVRDEQGSPHAPSIMALRLGSDGTHYDLVKVPAGGSKLPTSVETVRDHLHAIHLEGERLFRIAVRRLCEAVLTLLGDSSLSVTELSQVIIHQANGRMLAAIAKRLGISQEKMVKTIDQFGNTSSASLPIALDWANRHEKLHAGDLLVLGTFGGGLTWGTALLRWK